MAGVDRIVRRANLKEKLAHLEGIVRDSKPIMAAQTMLQNVFRDGFTKGYQAREDEYRKAEVDKKEAKLNALNTPTFDANPAEIIEAGPANMDSLTDKVQL